MDPQLIVIIPSRGRPEAVAELHAAWRDTYAGYAAPLWIIDHDDPRCADYLDAFGEESRRYQEPLWSFDASRNNGSMVAALNHGARSLVGLLAERLNAPYIGFMGDDHRPRTQGWDFEYCSHLAGLVNDRGAGIVYGDDKLQGVNLPTQVAMTSNIVKVLGRMCPETLVHMYVDNYWMTLGRGCGILKYLPSVVIEHMHPLVTHIWTEGHTRVNGYMGPDGERFARFVESGEMGRDIIKIRGLRGGI